MTDTERLVTQKEAAERADVTVRTVQRWIEAGLLTAYRSRAPRRVRVDPDELDALSRPVPQ